MRDLLMNKQERLTFIRSENDIRKNWKTTVFDEMTLKWTLNDLEVLKLFRKIVWRSELMSEGQIQL